MRLSTIKTDPGYKPASELRKYVVLLNGKKETICVIADEEEGYVVREMRVRNPFSRQTKLQRSGKIFGKVEIRERT